MAESTNEKVIRLETQMSNVVSEIAEIKSLVKEVSNKIDNQATLGTKIELLEQEVLSLKAKTFRNGWIFPTLSATASAVLTFLLIYFITDIKG